MAARFLHLADIHLGARQKYLPVEKQEIRTHELFQSFTQLIYQAMEETPPVDAILIAGDLFDSPFPDINLLGKVKAVFRDVAEKDIPVFLVPGNHDNIISPQSVFRRERFPGVTLLLSPNIREPAEVDIRGEIFHIYGLAYSFLSRPPFDSFQPAKKNVRNIALIHGSLVGNQEWQVHSQDIPLSAEALFKTGFDYVALGHYHNFRHYHSDGMHIVYPGCLEPLSWGDEGARKVVVVEFDRDEVFVRSTDVEFQKRFYRTIELDFSQHNLGSTEDVAEMIVKKYANQREILRLILTGPTEFLLNGSRLEALCESGFFYFQVEDRTRYTASEKLELIEQENTIRGLVVRKLLEKLQNTDDDEEKLKTQEALKILMGYFTID